MDLTPTHEHITKETNMNSGSLVGKLTGMFDNQEHCDITFDIQGRHLGAHKLVLIAQEFHLFAEHKDEAVINVRDIDYETFHSIIRNLYVEHIDINRKNIFKLMHAAQVLHETRLADMCSSYLLQRACVDNFVYLVNASVEFKNTTLQKHLSIFFGINMDRIIHDLSFIYLSPEVITLLMPVPPPISVCSNLQLFVMLRRWARAEYERQSGRLATSQDIRNIFEENFRKLRVPFLHPRDVARLIIGHDILTKEEELSLLHFLLLPDQLRNNVVPEDVPFDIELLQSKFCYTAQRDRASKIKLYSGNCGLCKAVLDSLYGAEIIHCANCDFDICMRCFSAPQHQHHRKFCCIKMVLGKSDDCCNSCGWPVKPSLFHGGDSKPATKKEIHTPVAKEGHAGTSNNVIVFAKPGIPASSFGTYAVVNTNASVFGASTTGSGAATSIFGATSAFGVGGGVAVPQLGGLFGNASAPPVTREPASTDPNLKLNSSEPDETSLCKNCKCPLKSEEKVGKSDHPVEFRTKTSYKL